MTTDARERLDIAQRSPEWLAARQSPPETVGASEVAAVLGVNKREAGYPQTYGLWLRKCGMAQPEVPNPHRDRRMRAGVQMEPVLREWLREALPEGWVLRGAESWRMHTKEGAIFFCSPDEVAVTPDGEVLPVEMKWVGRQTHAFALAGTVPPWYLPQVEVQMDVLDAQRGIYFSGREGSDQPCLVVVQADMDHRQLIRERVAAFQQAVRSQEPIGDPEREYGVVQVVDDEAAAALGRRIFDMRHRRDVALAQAGFDPKELEELEEALKNWAKARGPGAHHPSGSPLAVSVSAVAGLVDYKAADIVERLKGLDLNQYRKPGYRASFKEVDVHGD